MTIEAARTTRPSPRPGPAVVALVLVLGMALGIAATLWWSGRADAASCGFANDACAGVEDVVAGPVPRRVVAGADGTVRREGDPPLQVPEADVLYDNFGTWHAYLWARFGRDSNDDAGAMLDGEVGVAGLRTAHWDPASQQVRFPTGPVVLDVTVHELAHALLEHTAGLGHEGESGALNEAIADMFASNVDGNWSLGEDLPGGAVRDLAAPADLGLPMHVRDYEASEFATQSIHLNSAIPGHAYYLMVQDIGRIDAEQVLYRAIDRHLGRDAGFEDFRAACVGAATSLFGPGAKVDAVAGAFAAVGLDGTWEGPP